MSQAVDMLSVMEPATTAALESDSVFHKIIAAGDLYTSECEARADRLVVLADLDDSRVWESNGYASMNQWLVDQHGVSQATAAQWLRVGHALRDLPEIHNKFRTGELSWDKVKAATRLATADTDSAVADMATSATASQLAREARRVRRDRVGDAHRDRYLKWWWDDTRPVLHIEGRLPDAQGVVVAKALDLITQERLPDPHFEDADHIWEHYEARCADALYRMASQALGADSAPDKATVIVRVDAADLAAGVGYGSVPEGPVLVPDTVLRFACDARIQAVVAGKDSPPVGIGRVSRSIPPWLRRQILDRDGGCVFPGCERIRWVHIHHIKHWAHGGPTDLDNLVALCGFHHRLLHEDRWKISGDPNTGITWLRPNGTPHTPKPPTWTPSYRRSISEDAKPWLAFRVRGTARDDTS